MLPGGEQTMSGSRFNLSALAVRERSVTLFLIILVTIAGIYAFFGLGRAEDPPFTVKQMTVITVWPGATAQEMQDQVAEPLEKRLQELKWYDRTETYTRPGMAFITLSLQDKTPPSRCRRSSIRRGKSLGMKPKSPRRRLGPMINDEFADVTFALFALKAKGEPQRQLVRDAEGLRQQLLHVPGVKKVNIIGEQAERIYISFSHDRLATMGSRRRIFSMR
jgi:multidrug efflux pump subunit AcrB